MRILKRRELNLKKVSMFWERYKEKRMAVVGLIVIVVAVFVAIFAPLLTFHDPFATSYRDIYRSPDIEHLMGTDDLGRDVLSQIIYGSRVSLLFALGVTVLSLVVGIFLGSVAGYFGGVIDDVFMRFTEIFIMVPRLLLIIIMVAIYGTNIVLTMLVVGLTVWPTNAKITRTQVLSLKNRGYVQASLIAGGSTLHILLRHILPNGFYPVVANSILQMGTSILFEASLSFLGLGDPNQMSWGQIIHRGQFNFVNAWWTVVFPTAAIIILVLSFNLIGDGINYALNPRQRRAE